VSYSTTPQAIGRTSLISTTVFLAGLSLAFADLQKVDNVAEESLTNAARAAVATLEKVGQPISDDDRIRLFATFEKPGSQAIGMVQEVLDRYCLLGIRINEEGWLSTTVASNNLADHQLVQGKWKYFLIKINNESAVKAPLAARSPQELWPEELKNAEAGADVTSADANGWYRWMGLQTYDPPLTSDSPGPTVRYLVLGIFGRDQGMRAANLEFYFNGGAVSQGHYTSQRLLFDVVPAAQAAAKK
jgi:hypothetical protein